MVKCKVPLILLVAFAATLLAGAQDDNRAPDQKLVRYIQDARKAGLQPPQIRQKAIEAGWEPATVEAGLAAALKLEALLITRLSFPFGLSVTALAQKKAR